jgi:thiol-disulfide isomerase/thioredoxin
MGPPNDPSFGTAENMPKFAVKSIPPLLALVLAPLLALAPAAAGASDKPGLASGQMANFVAAAAPAPLPEIGFVDGEGRPVGLDAFRGKLVLLNLWATWCAPCRREMASLDRLQAKLGGERFQVLALSADRQGPSVVPPFYAELGIKHLGVYNDAAMKSHRALRALGLPTTILIDPQGRELGRLIGPAEWDSPEAEALIRHYLEKPAGG